MTQGDIDALVEARVAEIKADEAVLMRYDLDGDGAIDDEEWDYIRTMVRAEILTERKRARTKAASTDQARALVQGRYRILRPLGHGGQAETLLAEDTELGGEVVIKRLAMASVVDWKQVQLFQREASVLEALDHRSIPSYVDAFEEKDADGGVVAFNLVQEYVRGTTLAHKLDKGLVMGEHQLAALATKLLEVLVYLQSLRPPVVHRDLKPSNIIMRDDGGISLVDFGAIQATIPLHGGGSTIVGTSGYMSPEQFMGRAGPSTDLYALGAVLVHVMGGVHPADLPVERMRLVYDQVVQVPPRLQGFVAKLLAPSVEDRYHDAAEAFDALWDIEHGKAAPVVTASSAPLAGSDAPGATQFQVDRFDELRRVMPGSFEKTDHKGITYDHTPRELSIAIRTLSRNLPHLVLPSIVTLVVLFVLFRFRMIRPLGPFVTLVLAWIGVEASRKTIITVGDYGYALYRKGLFGKRLFASGGLRDLKPLQFGYARGKQQLVLEHHGRPIPVAPNHDVAAQAWIRDTFNRHLEAMTGSSSNGID